MNKKSLVINTLLSTHLVLSSSWCIAKTHATSNAPKVTKSALSTQSPTRKPVLGGPALVSHKPDKQSRPTSAERLANLKPARKDKLKEKHPSRKTEEQLANSRAGAKRPNSRTTLPRIANLKNMRKDKLAKRDDTTRLGGLKMRNKPTQLARTKAVDNNTPKNKAAPLASRAAKSKAPNILKRIARRDKHAQTILSNQVGLASYYSDKFQGRRTASGEIYDKNKLTTVHEYYPFGTLLRVTNLRNNRSVTVKVTDRAALPDNRVLDLSKQAAVELDFIRSGYAKVKVEVLG